MPAQHIYADAKAEFACLQAVYKLDGERLYATYFGGEEKQGLKPDEEARQIWSALLHHSFSIAQMDWNLLCRCFEYNSIDNLPLLHCWELCCEINAERRDHTYLATCVSPWPGASAMCNTASNACKHAASRTRHNRTVPTFVCFTPRSVSGRVEHGDGL